MLTATIQSIISNEMWNLAYKQDYIKNRGGFMLIRIIIGVIGVMLINTAIIMSCFIINEPTARTQPHYFVIFLLAAGSACIVSSLII